MAATLFRAWILLLALLVSHGGILRPCACGDGGAPDCGTATCCRGGSDLSPPACPHCRGEAPREEDEDPREPGGLCQSLRPAADVPPALVTLPPPAAGLLAPTPLLDVTAKPGQGEAEGRPPGVLVRAEAMTSALCCFLL